MWGRKIDKRKLTIMKQTPILLHIETATDVCSVALSRGAEIIGLKEEAGGNNHAKTSCRS